MFKCNQCGACCKLLVKDHAPELDRGDGICKYLKDNKCTIYEDRPMKCRHGTAFKLYNLDQVMTKQEYDDLSTEMCKKLKAEADAKF